MKYYMKHRKKLKTALRILPFCLAIGTCGCGNVAEDNPDPRPTSPVEIVFSNISASTGGNCVTC